MTAGSEQSCQCLVEPGLWGSPQRSMCCLKKTQLEVRLGMWDFSPY